MTELLHFLTKANAETYEEIYYPLIIRRSLKFNRSEVAYIGKYEKLRNCESGYHRFVARYLINYFIQVF